MTDASDFLNLIGTSGPGPSFLDDIGINSMPSTSLSQGSSDQFFNMDSYQNFNNRQPGTTHQKLHHLDGQSPNDTFQPFSQKLSHYANPMLNQQNAFPNSAPGKPQAQRFPGMPMHMASPTQYNSTPPGSSPGSPWRGKTNVNNSFANYMPQQPSPEQGIAPGSMPQSFPAMSQQQTNNQRLQHFMTNKQTNPMLAQSQNPFLNQQSKTTLTDISNSTPKMNSENKASHLSSPNVQQYPADMVRQEPFNKLHHLVGGPIPSPSSDSSTNTATSLSGFPTTGNSFTPSPDPFLTSKNPATMYQNVQQPHANLPNQQSIQSPDPFAQAQPTVSMQQDYMMRRQAQFVEAGYPVRPASSYQPQMANKTSNQISGQLKSAHLLYQLQRLQQQITQVRDLPSPGRDQPLQQLQQQFSRLYHMYLMDQQRQKKQFQAVQMGYDNSLLKQQQQDKANRIVAEAIAKSALMNNAFNFQMDSQKYNFGQSYGPAVKGPLNYDMKQDIIAQRKAAEPIVLPPSLINQLPKTVRSSSKPPATVLSKPVVNRQRKDSDEHEPSPPASPGSYFPEEYQPASITRRSLRERKKKTYKDDFDYNLSEEDDTGDKLNSEGQPMDMGIVEDIPLQEETLTVEKILGLRTVTKEDGNMTEEFLVKYKNYSYLHCDWATAEKLVKVDKRVPMKIKRYFQKRNAMPFPDEIDDEPFNPDYVEVDRVLDVSTGVDQTSQEPVSHYLIKWRSLPYDESTWEVEGNVDTDAIQIFRNNQMVPPPHERQFRRRPHPTEWRKLDQTPVFKGSNVLREYQLEGLNWLTFCWYNGQNCILADEMGLGKTIQSLTFLVHVQQYGIRSPFLVIAPLSTIANWQREFETWSGMNAVVYHGSAASRQLIQQYEFYFRGSQGEPVIGVYKFNVLITTYEILIADNMLLSGVPWRVVVIDEAHRLKNRNCKLLEGLNNLQMEHRILLTGTPLQNNVDELFSLLNFLEPAQFPSQAAFLMEFGNLRTEAQVERLQALLRPMMLRRMKEDVEKSLAPKQETIVEVELTTVQKKFYRAILERNFSFLSKGAVSTSNVPNLMNTMMELRKCCNHPFLINGAEEKIVGEYLANVTGENRETVHLSSLIEASGKLVLIDKLLPKLKAGGHKVLVFSQMVRCLDILEDYLICKKYLFERIDGRVRGNLRQAAIDRFSKPDSDRFVFLLCTRAGGLGINLTAADTVIIFDSDWNPQNDLQAQARCHRIGQAKSVKVYRLITRNSYEREMFDRASMKLGLDKAVLQSMSRDNSASTPGQNPALTKKEIEDLLRKGAYGAVMDDDEASSKFCEEDIDQILERRTQVITIDSVGQGSSFAKASFTATKKGDDIDIDDPDFWRKWAMKADIDVDELLNKDERIIDAPRQRKQTKRYGKEDDVDFELSDLDSDEDTPQPKKRAWTRVECFKVEKNLLVFGWERWKDIIHAIRKRKLLEREVEAISRSILLFCVHAYRGDEKLRSFILELIKPIYTRERLPSEELDATYMPLQKPGAKKAKKSSKKNKSGGKPMNKSAIALLEAIGDWKSINPELLILDEGYKKHLRHHCNKILLRVRLLNIMRCEVIGPMETAVQNNCSASEVNVNLPITEGDPPTDWWDVAADKSLVIGVYKHGYERYNAIRADPCLCFLTRCGPPTSQEDTPNGDTLDGEGREDDDSKDDPDYQLPTLQDRKVDEVETDDEEFDVDGKEARPTNVTTNTAPVIAVNVATIETKDVPKPPIPQPLAVPSMEPTSGFTLPLNPAPSNHLLPWPTPSDLNTRLRRIVAGFQRILKKEELKRVAVEKENRRKEKVEEAVRQKELKKAEQAQKWSKREEVDFYRCVSTYGVHINPATGDYDWSKFRQMARLDKKNDGRLSQYFREFLAMCKRVCGRATDEEIIQGQNVEPISEERASRCLRRVELMTMLRLEVLNHPELDERLKLAQLTPELPSWWQCQKHDKDLLIGVSKHGLTRTDLNILEDPALSFYELKSEMEAQHVAMTGTTGDTPANVGSPESTSRSMNSTPVTFERPLDKSVLEKIEKLESQEGSLDNQSFPVLPTKSPTISIPENGITPPDVLRKPGEQSSPTFVHKQNYVHGLPPMPGSDALSSLVKQVSSLPSSNHLNPENPTSTAGQAGEKGPENLSATFVERTPTLLESGSLLTMTPVVTESLTVKLWWPKDRVVFHRVQQLCHCVVSGEWPSKQERVERNVDQTAGAELSVSPGAFQAFTESEMDASFAAAAAGAVLGPEGSMTDPASKAFKVKKHEGLKVTLKKNRKRKKKEGEALDGSVLPGQDPSLCPSYPDLVFPMNMEPPQLSSTAQPGGMIEKPRKKRQRKEKPDKPPKPLTEKKKRGRKPKAEKLLAVSATVAAASANAVHTTLSSQPTGELQEWGKGSSVFMPSSEMINGPQESSIVNDVEIRRASLDHPHDESRFAAKLSSSEGQAESKPFRPSVLQNVENNERDTAVRRLSSTSCLPDNLSSSFESSNVPGNPATIPGSPATTPTVHLSPFNSNEFQFGSNPYLNYPNFPNSGMVNYSTPTLTTAPGFSPGYSAGQLSQTKTSAASSPTSTTSTGSVSSNSQKPSTFPYDSTFPVTTPTSISTSFSESFGFNGFSSGLPTSSLNYTKQLGLDDEKMFDSDSDNNQSDVLGDSDDEGIPLGPATS